MVIVLYIITMDVPLDGWPMDDVCFGNLQDFCGLGAIELGKCPDLAGHLSQKNSFL